MAYRFLYPHFLFLLMSLSSFAQVTEAAAAPSPEPVGQVLYVNRQSADRVGAAWLELAARRPEFAGSAFVAPPTNDWTGLVVRAMESMPPEQASEAGQQLSKALQTGVLHLALGDDGRAWYFYWDKGQLVDRYNSNPGRPGEVPLDVVRAWQGRPDLLLPVARGTPLSKLRSEVSLTDFNGFLYSYYPEMKVERPASWRTAPDLMLLLVQVMGVPHSPASYLSLKSLPGWTRISPAAPGE